MNVDLGGTNGLIIGAQTSVGVELARRAEAAGAALVVLCDTDDRAWSDGGTALPPTGTTALARTRLTRGDAIELAQLFAGIRHDHGPLDWVCSVVGPDAELVRPPLPTADSRTDRPTPGVVGPAPATPAGRAEARGGRALADVIDITPPVPVRPWPELSLARIVTRTERTFVRSAVVTRLAVEEFRHRGGALLHVWAASVHDGAAEDALWEANRTALDALARAGVAPADDPDEPATRIGLVDIRQVGEAAVGDVLAALLGRRTTAAVVSLIRDNV